VQNYVLLRFVLLACFLAARFWSYPHMQHSCRSNCANELGDFTKIKRPRCVGDSSPTILETTSSSVSRMRNTAAASLIACTYRANGSSNACTLSYLSTLNLLNCRVGTNCFKTRSWKTPSSSFCCIAVLSALNVFPPTIGINNIVDI
jgi:hypothetical protein